MKGKIIQIISAKNIRYTGATYELTVLCDNGTIWARQSSYPVRWVEINTDDFKHESIEDFQKNAFPAL